LSFNKIFHQLRLLFWDAFDKLFIEIQVEANVVCEFFWTKPWQE